MEAFFVYHNDKDVLLAFGGQGSRMLDFGIARDRSIQPEIIHVTFSVPLNILCKKSIII